MKTKNRKQTRENIAGQPCPPQKKPVPPAESGTTDSQASGITFGPLQNLKMLCLANPADPHSKFNIEWAMRCHRSVVPKNILPEWIKEAKALATSEGVTVFDLASRGKLSDPFSPSLLEPRVWIEAWCSGAPEALANVNACYPGIIYNEPGFLQMIRDRTIQAYYGDTPLERNMANDWLRTVFNIPAPQRKKPRKNKTQSGRSAEIHLSFMQIQFIRILYMDIVIVRKVLSLNQDDLLCVLPEFSPVKEQRLDWFKKVVSDSKRPSSIDIACEIVVSIPESGLQGHSPESIRRNLDRQSRKMKLDSLNKLDTPAREVGKRIVEEFNK